MSAVILNDLDARTPRDATARARALGLLDAPAQNGRVYLVAAPMAPG